MAFRKTLLIDFDGTISKYDGWKGLTVLGDPIEKARAALLLLSRDFTIYYFTTRQADIVEQWLVKWAFPKGEVGNVKKPAHLIIDDRAIQFEGEWTDELIARIRNFKPYWEQSQNLDKVQD